MVTLHTQRLRIRELTLDDADAVFAYASDSEVHRFMTWPRPESPEDTHDFLRKCVRDAHTHPRSSYELAIVDAATNQLIGAIGIHEVNAEHKRGEIGYILHRDQWGKGLMTEALGEVLKFGFTTLELQRLDAYHVVANAASGAVMKKAGMQCEGRVRSYLNIRGEQHDCMRYAITASDFFNGDSHAFAKKNSVMKS